MRLAALVLLVSASAGAAPPRTFRVDYFHTGSGAEELFSLDRLVVEPLPWPGNPGAARRRHQPRASTSSRSATARPTGSSTRAASPPSTASGRRPARRRSRRGPSSESLRFPAPDAPVQVVLKKRDAGNAFREIWSLVVDPNDLFVDTAAPPSPGAAPRAPEERRRPTTKVDLLILGDGYTAAERGKFEKDARRLVEILFSYSPFKERQAATSTSGASARRRASPASRGPPPASTAARRVGATYDAFGSERYVLTFDNRAFRDVASFAPVRVRRDPGQRQHLRRRRHLQPLQHGGRRQRSGRRTSSSTSSATTSPAWPTSTTPRTPPTSRPRTGSSRGSRTSPRCWTRRS